MGIGKAIKRKRNDAHITQKNLALMLGVSFQAVSRWEREEVDPSINTIKKLANIFNCSVDELIYFGDNEENDSN